jgi:hypothetical protein
MEVMGSGSAICVNQADGRGLLKAGSRPVCERWSARRDAGETGESFMAKALPISGRPHMGGALGGRGSRGDSGWTFFRGWKGPCGPIQGLSSRSRPPQNSATRMFFLQWGGGDWYK